MFVGRGLALDAVSFPYARPAHAADYALVYTEHSSFDAPRLVARLQANLLELPLRRDEAALAGFLDDGRICLTNNAAERSLRGFALGRKAWLFAGSPRGGDRAAFMYSLIVTAKMNDVDPQAWLADVLARLPDIPLSRLPELLPWNWSQIPQRRAA